MEDECPVCLEPLIGTVVHLGCCKKQVHIQCYVSRCPMCRAELPVPPNHHIIVPVPVEIQRPNPKWKMFLGNIICIMGVGCAATMMFWSKPT